MNPFEILEVPPDASPEDIRAAYHRLAKVWHPDRFMGEEKAKAEEKFRQVADAFSQLKDPLKRQAFAAALPKPGTPTAPPQAGPAPSKASSMERKPEDWVEEARKTYEAGDVDRAKGLVQYAIRLDGSKADYHVLLADLLEASGDQRGAVKALEAAHKLRPKDADVLVRLADHFQAVGMQARAARLLEQAKSLQPGHRRFKPSGSAPMQKVKTEGEGGLVDQLKGMWNKWTRKGDKS